MLKNATYLFVYGTLREKVAHPMRRIVDRYGVFQGMGTFRGRLYDLGRYPGAVASAEDSDRIVGEIYRLQQAAKALTAISHQEFKTNA